MGQIDSDTFPVSFCSYIMELCQREMYRLTFKSIISIYKYGCWDILQSKINCENRKVFVKQIGTVKYLWRLKKQLMTTLKYSGVTTVGESFHGC